MLISNGAGLQFAPQALAEYSPIPSGTGYFYAKQGVELLNQFQLYGQLYAKQPWVAAVVNKVAKGAARLTINVWDHSGSGEKVLDETSAYAKFWARPCPILTTYGLIFWTVATKKIYGEAFWYILRDGSGTPVGVYPMHPSRTQIRRNKDTGDVEYVFALGVASAGILVAPESDVVPFQSYHPDGLMRGMSPLEPLRSTLFNEDAARRAMESWWRKGARPSVVFAAPEELSDKAYGRLLQQINDAHAGADNMGSTLLLEQGVKPTPLQLSAEEMQYIESRQLNREEVCGVYDVSPPVVHILDHATFSNIVEQNRAFYRDTMAPDLEEIEAVWDFYLRPNFDPTGQVEARFALDDVLRGDFETRAEAVATLIQNGVMKPSEGRPLFDLDDAGPDADRLYANSAIQPLGYPAEQVRITAGDPANPLPLTPGEQEALDETEQERRDESAPATSASKRQRERNQARRARARQSRLFPPPDDESEED